MTYYIIGEDDNRNELWDENQLGEVSFKSFYVGKGMEALSNMIRNWPKALSSIEIIDERKNSFTVEEFLILISQYKIIEMK